MQDENLGIPTPQEESTIRFSCFKNFPTTKSSTDNPLRLSGSTVHDKRRKFLGINFVRHTQRVDGLQKWRPKISQS